MVPKAREGVNRATRVVDKLDARNVFLDLAREAHVVVDGLRAGTMARFALSYAAVSAVRSSIVYCSLSGMGQTGPYRRLGVHGPAFDAFAGIAPVAFREDGLPCMAPHTTVGTQAGALIAAFAVAAGLVKAGRTGRGQYIDVAQIDAVALWRASETARGLNLGWDRVAFAWKADDAVRGQYYETRDGKYVIFQPLEEKFWQSFCRAVDRPDLLARSSGKPTDLANGDEALRAELVPIMKTKTQAEWVEFFIQANVPGGPVHALAELVEDPHFQARGNIAAIEDPEVGHLLMPTTPIKLPDQTYKTTRAPRLGEHTDDILSGLLGYDRERIAALRAKQVIL